MIKFKLSKRLIKNIYGNDFISIGYFIYYKTQTEMRYKWIQSIMCQPLPPLLHQVFFERKKTENAYSDMGKSRNALVMF